MTRWLLSLLCVLYFWGGVAFAQGIESFTIVDPLTGKTTTGSVTTTPGGFQNYSWQENYGTKPMYGTVAPPTGQSRNFSITDGLTGQTTFGSVYGFPSPPPAPFLPMFDDPPASGSLDWGSGMDSWGSLEK